MHELFSLFRNFPGMPSFGQETRHDLHASGIVKINGTKVNQETRVSGTLTCNNADLNQLGVSGTTSISDTIIRGGSKFIGLLQAYHTNFNGDIEIISSEASLKKSTTKNITFKQQEPSVDQRLVLDETIISGKVTFESGNGKIFLNNNSVIHGEVKGAQVINNNPVNRL